MENPNRPNLPDAALWIERVILVGDSISQMLFGIVFTVFLQIMYALLKKPGSSSEGRKWSLIIYTIILFSLGVTFVGLDLWFLQTGYVDNREFPGGPTAYSLSQYGKPATVIGNACAIVSDWLAAGLLLYRCLVIFHLKPYIVAFPILMYLGLIAMGCLVLYSSSRPYAHLWTRHTITFGVPYFTLSAALNVTITTMICIRLLMYRRSLQRAIGPNGIHDGSIPIASITSMLVESSALYTVISILFIVPYGLGSFVSLMFLANLSMIQILAPFLIILRVANNTGWDTKTGAAYTSTIKFQSTAHTSTINESDGGDTQIGLEKPRKPTHVWNITHADDRSIDNV